MSHEPRAMNHQACIKHQAIRLLGCVSGQFKTRPKRRQTALDVPVLSCWSAHPKFIHRNWPQNLLWRQFRLCMDNMSRHNAKSQLLERFIRSDVHPHALHVIRNTPLTLVEKFRRKAIPKRSWLILGHHPVYEMLGISRRLKAITSSALFLHVWSVFNFDQLCIGCRKALPSFGSRVQHSNRRSVGVGG